MNKVDYSKKRILVVENVIQSRDTLKIFAKTLGAMKVDTCHYAQQILALCQSIKFDVILLGYDLGEDKKNGQQILEELRSKQLISRHCAIVIITAEISQAMVLAALEHKPDEYLIKPFSLHDLSIRLQRCFHKKSDMFEIYNAMDSNNSAEVLLLCEQAIANNSIYKTECFGIKSRQYFELEEFDKAKEIYEACLRAPNCQWASIGLGKIALVKHNTELAIYYFLSVVNSHPLYLSAYDWLAKAYQLDDQPTLAEAILEKALLVSPLSVPRLKQYADLCLSNENFDKATYAFSKTTDLAYHSVHKKPENALHFVEALLEHAESLTTSEIRKLSYKAFTALTDMVQDFSSAEIKIQSRLLAARLHRKIKDPQRAKEALQEAERLLSQASSRISNLAKHAIANSLNDLNKTSYATVLLKELARDRQDKAKIVETINPSPENHQKDNDKIAAQNALEISLDLYKTEQYSSAIDKLNNALVHFPNHIGIKLNLLQILLVSFDKNRERIKDFGKAEVLIKEFEKLKSNSEFYIRYIKLKNKYTSIQTSLANS